MLVITWEVMNEAIARLEAEDKLSAYTVAVLASPVHDEDARVKRQRIVDQWRQTAIGRAKRQIEVTVARLSEMLREAFGGEVTDSTDLTNGPQLK